MTIREGRRSSQTISTARLPQAQARRVWPASMAGTLVAPGKVRPMASMMEVIVLAVPMVLQVPGARVIFASSEIHSGWSMSPTTYCSQYFLVCVPAPTVRPL